MDLNENRSNIWEGLEGENCRETLVITISTFKIVQKWKRIFFLPLCHLCYATPPSVKGKNRKANLSRDRNERVGKRMG